MYFLFVFLIEKIKHDSMKFLKSGNHLFGKANNGGIFYW